MNRPNEMRQLRAYSILAKGDTPIALNKENFVVPSQSGEKKYIVSHTDAWTCECKDFKFRNQSCKHIYTIQFWLKLRDGIGQNELMELDTAKKKECGYCKSLNIVKNGNRKTKFGTRQRFLCRDCKKRFVIEPIKRIKGDSKVATLVMDLYYKGLSLRDITDTIYQFYGLKLHHETVRRWIMRLTKSIDEYTKTLKPKVSEAWHSDEQMIKVKGKWVWSWNVLDEETRFLIANNITKSRYVSDARQVFKKSLKTVGTIPNFVITDGLHSYESAIRKEFGNPKNCRLVRYQGTPTLHVRAKSLRDKRVNNNVIERYHSTFRERDKVMRGFKSEHTAQALSDGFRNYYNFVRPHSTLNTTPAIASGIDLKLGRNRWLSLLKKSVDSR